MGFGIMMYGLREFGCGTINARLLKALISHVAKLEN
jgi:hypothetical protein